MNTRFFLAIGIVVIALSVLMFSAVRDTKKAVVTVAELVEQGVERSRIRLGARVAGSDIEVKSEPVRLVRFMVEDPGQEGGPTIPVEYEGAMPDTLQVGRDVILEGAFVSAKFKASSLMTQCPSKYEPPIPGSETSSKSSAKYGSVDSDNPKITNELVK